MRGKGRSRKGRKKREGVRLGKITQTIYSNVVHGVEFHRRGKFLASSCEEEERGLQKTPCWGQKLGEKKRGRKEGGGKSQIPRSTMESSAQHRS